MPSTASMLCALRRSAVQLPTNGVGAPSLCRHGAEDHLLVDRFEGKHINSPNDVVVKSDGSIYFTDPPYGLKQGDKDPAKEPTAYRRIFP